MSVKLSEEYRSAVEAVALQTDLPVELLVELLDLESRHQNLHGWGARPALRREIATILDRAIEAGAARVVDRE